MRRESSRTRSSIGKLSRTKGRKFEQEVARFYRSAGLEARRGQQGSGGKGEGDVILPLIPGLHIECKRLRSLGSVGSAWNQAMGDSDGRTTILHVREDRGTSLVILPLDLWDVLMVVLGGIIKEMHDGSIFTGEHRDTVGTGEQDVRCPGHEEGQRLQD